MKNMSALCKLLFLTAVILWMPLTKAEEHDNYQRTIAEKAGNGIANLATGWLEIPKNVINTTNNNNFIVGFFGGMLKGMVNMAGRTGVGVIDLVTFPIPTQPIVQPALIWDDFDVDTHYGQSFRLPKD